MAFALAVKQITMSPVLKSEEKFWHSSAEEVK